MTILTLDGSGPYAVVVLSDERGEVLSSVVFEASRTLSTRLFSQIEAILSTAGLEKKDLSALAVGTGPGSFTGVRIALTTFRTMAQASGLPLVGVSTLDAYAEPFLSLSFERPVVAVLNSRRNEVYLRVYRNGYVEGDAMAVSVDIARQTLAGLALSSGGVVVCGRTDALGEPTGAMRIDQRFPSPDGLARLAARRLNSGDADSSLALLPEYIVAPIITTPRDPSILTGSAGPR
jgi:tRNA threonylcarbamoyladenosine biosynthesis protein TsaB